LEAYSFFLESHLHHEPLSFFFLKKRCSPIHAGESPIFIQQQQKPVLEPVVVGPGAAAQPIVLEADKPNGE
jgi:hypothetical protein